MSSPSSSSGCIREIVRDEEFRDLLIVCWETGCRPQEALRVEGRHVDLEGGCWAFPVDEAKGKKHSGSST